MRMESHRSRSHALRLPSSILAGGLIAGTLDILAAFAYSATRGGTPPRVLKGIAAGLLGRAAREGGAGTALLGLALHFLIATTACALYLLASRPLPALARRPFVFGPLYGVVVWAFMNLVVVPLSAIGPRPLAPVPTAIMVGIHIACVGLPIALWARRTAGQPLT